MVEVKEIMCRLPEANVEAESAFNYAEALSRVEGDTELLAELAGLFLESYPEQLSAIRIAVRDVDAKAVQHASHTLKGSVGNFAARAAFDAALELENIGRSGDLSSAAAAAAKLSATVEQLAQALVAATRESACKK
jgi:HPt (histidine-containing phosphotransfer) domain-containing protein